MLHCTQGEFICKQVHKFQLFAGAIKDRNLSSLIFLSTLFQSHMERSRNVIKSNPSNLFDEDFVIKMHNFNFCHLIALLIMLIYQYKILEHISIGKSSLA